MSKKVSPQEVLQALKKVEDTALHQDIVSLAYVKDIEVGFERAMIAIGLKASTPSGRPDLAARVRKTVEALAVPHVEVEITSPAPPPPRGPSNLIPYVKHTIAVASGKGGVGKSTVAANLA